MWQEVVVTGGAGFIGTNLVEALLKQNGAKSIVVFDNYTSGSKANEFQDPRVRYVTGDTWDILELLDDVNPEIVFHFGEFSRIVTSFDQVNYVTKSNGLGTQRVCEFCVRKNAKLLYSGSSSIFGNDCEDSNLSPYAFLKKTNIQLLKNYHAWFGLNYVVTYFYNVYGERDLDTGDYATVIAKFRKQYVANKPRTVVTPGNQKRCFTHVSDIIAGVLLCARLGEGDGYKLASNDNVTILALAAMFGPEHVMVPERRGERFCSEVGSSRARDELDWEPLQSLEPYIRDFKLRSDV